MGDGLQRNILLASLWGPLQETPKELDAYLGQLQIDIAAAHIQTIANGDEMGSILTAGQIYVLAKNLASSEYPDVFNQTISETTFSLDEKIIKGYNAISKLPGMEVYDLVGSTVEKRTKDIFVFGCTVALRVSDLLNLKKTNIERFGEVVYLRTISKKTGIYSKIKLPQYAVEIIDRHKSRTNNIFQPIGTRNLNKYIKELAEQAQWTQQYPKIRRRRGKPVEKFRNNIPGKHFRFCDLISTHTMRRTAITTMLNLGVEEGNVRMVSGHAPGSVEFYKYVKYSQQKVDDDLDMMHKKLSQKWSGPVK